MKRKYVHLIVLFCSFLFVLMWIAGYFARYRTVLLLSKPPLQIADEINLDVNSNEIILKDIEMEPIRGKNNIIFLETSCAVSPNKISDSGLLLTKRQACSIESAAKMNPDAAVHLLYTCPLNGGMKASLPHVKELFVYPNIKIWKLDMPKFLQETALKNWDFNKHISSSKWPVEHASDVLRYVSLYKYGGLYLDLDIVVRKSLDELGANYLGKENSDLLSACALNFKSEGIGHNFSQLCVDEIFNNFLGDVWNHNGPDLVTKICKRICDVNEIKYMTPERCKGLKVLPENIFTPLPYYQWEILFSSQEVYENMEKLNTSYGVHAWNHMSKEGNINLLIQQPYGLLALKYCPRVHAHSDINF